MSTNLAPVLRRLAEEVGALEDGYLAVDEMQAMFARALRERGHDVFYEVLDAVKLGAIGLIVIGVALLNGATSTAH
jgi:hypothetical protein